MSLGNMSLYTRFNAPIEQVLVDVEFIVDQLNDEDLKNQTRNNSINIITNYLNSLNSDINSNDKQMTKDIIDTFKFIKENSNDIVITKADKGNTTVILNRSEYEEKAIALLNDSTIYKKLKKRSYSNNSK